MMMTMYQHRIQFLSTPSARRATTGGAGRKPTKDISIHALREEGDDHVPTQDTETGISIHALREEGDQGTVDIAQATPISIHALREEGDTTQNFTLTWPSNFYPRPPRGGRHWHNRQAGTVRRFLSTPSARRATYHTFDICQ